MAMRVLVVDRPPPLPLAVTRPGVLNRLRWANLGIAAAHFGQAAIIGVFGVGLGADVADGVTSAAPTTVSVGLAITIFFVALGLGHLASATALHQVYVKDLRRGRNGIRWATMYATAPIVMVLIASMAGIRQSSQLLLVIAATFAMVVFGSLQELLNPPGQRRTTMVPLWAALAVGLVPWVMIGIHLLSTTGGDHAATTFVSLFVLWAIAWVNTVLQYQQVGPWADYLYGERTSMIVCVVVNSALAWQILAASAVG